MSTSMIEVMVLAVVAGVVLFRLYQVLGRRTGSERPSRPAPAQGELVSDEAAPRPLPRAGLAAGEGEGVAGIIAADPSFDPDAFLTGARSAYEMIVDAFAKGDRDALRPLLTPRVFETYAKAITDREASGGKGPELVRLRTAEMVEARLEGSTASVAVRFEAELAEGAHHVRDTKERWTFERDVRSTDPNWRLARVAQA